MCVTTSKSSSRSSAKARGSNRFGPSRRREHLVAGQVHEEVDGHARDRSSANSRKSEIDPFPREPTLAPRRTKSSKPRQALKTAFARERPRPNSNCEQRFSSRLRAPQARVRSVPEGLSPLASSRCLRAGATIPLLFRGITSGASPTTEIDTATRANPQLPAASSR